MTPSVSKAISATRFLIILGPVMIHCQGTFEATPYRLFLGEMVGRITVPLLFIISGYLFFQKFDGSLYAYKNKLKKRCSSLIIPYLLWNFLAFLFYWGIGVAEGSDFMSSFWVVDYHSGHSPADGPLWFLRILILLLPLTPLMYVINKRRWLSWLSLAFYLMLFSNMGVFKQGSIIGFACFNLGAYFALSVVENKLINVKIPLPSIYWILLLLMMIFACACVGDYFLRTENGIRWGLVHWSVLTIGGLFTMIVPAVMGGRKLGALEELGKSSFFLFCLHEPLIPYISQYVIKFAGNSNVGYTLTIIFDVIICLAAYYILRKLSPKVLAILNGGR